MEIKLVILGAGYVGLTTAACFAELGYQVACVDLDKERINDLREGKTPFYEPGLDDLIEKNTRSQRLSFYTELKDLSFNPSLYIIAVGTPMQKNGSANMSFIYEAAKNIAAHMQKESLIVIKSTVPVGTTEMVERIIYQNLRASGKNIAFSTASNPEFLKQGEAVNDCLRPERIIVGVSSQTPSAQSLLRELYRPLKLPEFRYLEMSVREAEMTKYVANALLATKISFMNEWP